MFPPCNPNDFSCFSWSADFVKSRCVYVLYWTGKLKKKKKKNMETVRHKPKLSCQRIVRKMENALIYKNELHDRCFPQLEPPLYPSSLWLPGPMDLPKYPMTPGLSFPQEESVAHGGINFSLFCPDMLVRHDNNEIWTWEVRDIVRSPSQLWLCLWLSTVF